jgi:FkbM family methyltransferase
LSLREQLPGRLRSWAPGWFVRQGLVISRTMPGTNVRCRWRVSSKLDLYRISSAWVKEPGTIAWIVDDVRPGDVVWDIGANIGIYSVPLGHRVRGNGGRVVAVEPNLVNAASLLTNVVLNGLGDIVQIVAEPIAERSIRGLMPMKTSHLQSGKSGVQFVASEGAGVVLEPHGSVHRAVRSLSGPELVSLTRSQPDIIKIDVDGLDLEILRGLQELLTGRTRPRLISVEMRSGEPRFVDLMQAVGYRLREMNYSPGKRVAILQGRDASRVMGNGIFVPVEAPTRE